jgi:hypothetical protein
LNQWPILDGVKTRFNLKQTYERIAGPVKSGIGIFAALFTAVIFEVIENSQMIIELFKNNSGTQYTAITVL